METKKFFRVSALALSLTGWGIAPIFASQIDVTENLGGVGNVDTWQVTCKGKATVLSARVRDVSNLDDQYIITSIGLTPGGGNGIKAEADTERNTLGSADFSLSASLVRSPLPAGGMKAWVIVSQIVGGNGNYELRLTCSGTDILPDADLKQDQ